MHPRDQFDSPDIEVAISKALRKAHWNDRRLMILFLLLVAIVSLVLQQQVTFKHRNSEFQRIAIINCDTTRNVITDFQTFIRKQQNTIRESRILTPEEKTSRVADLDPLLAREIPPCPPGS